MSDEQTAPHTAEPHGPADTEPPAAGTSPDYVEPFWVPGPQVADTQIEHFRTWIEQRLGRPVPDYPSLHAWSVADVGAFWTAIWDFFGVQATTPGTTALASDDMPGAVWFPGATLNYVTQVFRYTNEHEIAVYDRAEPGGPAPRDVTRGELRELVAGLAATLRKRGIGQGDVVAGYLPNIAEAVVAFLATASIGAVWSACGPDYTGQAAVDRLGQLEPVALITADGYRYAGKDHDRRSEIGTIRTAIPTVRTTIVVSRLGLDLSGLADIVPWSEAIAPAGPLDVLPVPFEHPLWVLFSSGTTGKPKGLVHSHGGVLLEHLKQIALHCDLGPGSVYLWYTSTSWMMWNFQVAGLLVGASIVTYDGSPGHPSPDALWGLAADLNVQLLGTSPAYLLACERNDVHPAADHDLSALRVIGSTGSVLPPSSYYWVRDQFGPEMAVGAISGGTDVVSAFVGLAPDMPVYVGELAVACLGTELDAWDVTGESVRGEVGELVITKPMPSMPIYFWNDPDGAKYHDAYFSVFPGVWRHGDWITITDHGSVVIHGRSDSTLNRNGIRMGTADIYAAIEAIPQIAEALVVGVEYPDGSYWMPLFVALAEGVALDDGLQAAITTAIREKASPRHVPDEIVAVPAIPHTRTGKKLEVPIKRLLQGADKASVVDPRSVDDPALLDILAGAAHPERRTPRPDAAR